MKCIFLLFTVFFISSQSLKYNLREKVIAAVNCGGPEALGAHGITYSEDTLEEGTASDHGMQYSFSNADTDDVEIYQTERWSSESFEYEVPIAQDGNYVVILKFSEVYFQKAGEKVFHVRINSHSAVKDLDIFESAGGRGYAHDIYIPVEIKGKSISINGHSREFNGNLIIELAKGAHDNPKINGFAIVRGTPQEMPPVPEKYSQEALFDEDFDIYEEADPKEDSFKPKIIQKEQEIDGEEEEMFSAPATGSENPFEKRRLQESSTEWWLSVVAALIVIIPIAYIIHLKMDRENI